MTDCRSDHDETLVFNPVSQTRYQFERLATTLAAAVAILALDQLGPNRYGFVCVFVGVQLISTLSVHRSASLRPHELGIFLSIELLMANSAPFVMDSTWAPAVVITMYSVGVNAPRLSRVWVFALASSSVVAFGLSGWLLEVPGAVPLTIMSVIMAGHVVLRRSSDLLLAETAIGEMQQLQTRANEAAQQANWLAGHDPLTGLGNRRMLSELIDAAAAGYASVGLILLDLDGFKAVNDRHGHHYGDLVLLEVADRITTTLEATRTHEAPPVAIRLGGDEFAILLTNVDAPQARAIADRVYATVATNAQFGDVNVMIDASLGVALAEGLDLGELLQRADSAMYEAKRTGRGVSGAVASAASFSD